MDNEDISGEQSDWIEIHSPSSSTNKAQWYNNENSLVIKDSFLSENCAIFPPNNHEDLPTICPNEDRLNEGKVQMFHSSSSSSSSSIATTASDLMSDGDHNGEGTAEEAKVENINDAGSWMRTRFGLFFLSSGIEKFVLRMRNRAVIRIRNIWLFASATTGVGALVVLMVVLYRRAKGWRRQVQQPESKHHLMLLIKERDQKINQLVLQIAQLNDMLLARRKVPVLQVA